MGIFEEVVAQSSRKPEGLPGVLERRRERSRQAHDRLADRWEDEQQFAIGSLRAEVMAQALPQQLVFADLGCGTGFLTRRLAAAVAVSVTDTLAELAARAEALAAEVEEKAAG